MSKINWKDEEQVKEYKCNLTKQWIKDNREKWNYYIKNYGKTKYGRANRLLAMYNHSDINKGRGKGDLTAQWIVDNIFSKQCVHCGETNWKKIGCNRIDNSKSHMMDNVEPCCGKCNVKLNDNSDKNKTVYQYTLDGELVGVYESVTEAARQNDYSQSAISFCCIGGRYYVRNGVRKWQNCISYKGFKWRFTPLELSIH